MRSHQKIFAFDLKRQKRSAPARPTTLGDPWQIGQGISFIPFYSLASERCKSDEVKEAMHYSLTRCGLSYLVINLLLFVLILILLMSIARKIAISI
jgi:hypothetical protein